MERSLPRSASGILQFVYLSTFSPSIRRILKTVSHRTKKALAHRSVSHFAPFDYGTVNLHSQLEYTDRVSLTAIIKLKEFVHYIYTVLRITWHRRRISSIVALTGILRQKTSLFHFSINICNLGYLYIGRSKDSRDGYSYEKAISKMNGWVILAFE